MSNTASDTLSIARGLKAAGVEARQAGIDTTRSELQASISANQAAMARFLVIVAGVIVAANALTIGVLRFFPRDGAVM